jgi:anti-sigma factor ChrR (cupin superfamily)
MNEDVIAIHSQDIVLEDHKHVGDTGNVLYAQDCLNDEDTCMLVKIVRYPKGSIVPLHTHHCAHGMYVLKGTLHTNKGDFEPGSFVWFKEGNIMFHGGKDEDVECLFITNKAFDMQYI